MTKRTLPDWQYAHPDGRNERIKELEAEVVFLKAALSSWRGEAVRRGAPRFDIPPKKKGRKP